MTKTKSNYGRAMVACAAFFIWPLSLEAQESEAILDNRCWFGSKTYSAGATLYVGSADGRPSTCSETGIWQKSDALAAGCFFDDDFYSVGSFELVDKDDQLSLFCVANGQWQEISTTPDRN